MNKRIEWKILSFNDDLLNDLDDNIDGFEDEQENGQPMSFGIIQPSLPTLTPVGPIRFGSQHNVSDYFNFEIMYTNFDINENVFMQISNMPGVEVVRVLSRYQLIIGFGRLFKSSDVKVQIEHILTGKHINYLMLNSIENTELRHKSLRVYNKCSQYPYWAMYIFPNGEIDFCHTVDIEIFSSKIEELQNCQNQSNGMLLYENNERTP